MIDPEFAYMGPLAFDPAKIIGELIIPYFASDGHEAAAAAGGGGSSVSRSGQRVWLLEAIVEVWETFSTQFIELWTQHVNSSSSSSQAGDLTPPCVVGPDAANGHKALQACQRDYMQQLFADVTSFAGAFIIRRLVGIAHTADMDSISDPDTRAACELRALRFGRHLLVEGPNTYKDIRALAAAVAAARQVDGLIADTEAAGVNGVAASAEAAAL